MDDIHDRPSLRSPFDPRHSAVHACVPCVRALRACVGVVLGRWRCVGPLALCWAVGDGRCRVFVFVYAVARQGPGSGILLGFQPLYPPGRWWLIGQHIGYGSSVNI